MLLPGHEGSGSTDDGNGANAHRGVLPFELDFAKSMHTARGSVLAVPRLWILAFDFALGVHAVVLLCVQTGWWQCRVLTSALRMPGRARAGRDGG
eukprot:1459252-Rhodomonas_salina.1